MYRIVYTKQAAEDIKNIKAAGLEKKTKNLIEILRDNPFQNPPSYEGLVGNLQGFFSRRINIEHRLVYQVYTDKVEADGIIYEGTVKIVRMWTRYDDMR